MWRDPIRRARCLLPAEGWYEWHDTPSSKQPHYITRRDRRPFCFAGLYATWRDTLSCAILTMQALGPIAEVHDRMPVVLPEDGHAAWLEPALQDAAVATALALEPMAPEDFEHFPVSRRVNNARNEGADLVEPLRD
jgi:putative SOS response-associated peptidase YedK